MNTSKQKRSYIYNLQREVGAASATNSLDCVGVSVNLVALPTDPRYDPGHQYEDANVHLEISERAGEDRGFTHR